MNLKSLQALLLFITVIFTAIPPAHSEENRTQIAIVLSSSQSYYLQTATAFSDYLASHLAPPSFEASTYLPDTLIENTSPLDEADIIIAIGTTATRLVLKQNTGTPLLSILIPKSVWLDLKPQPTNTKQASSAIYLEQPAKRYIALANALPIRTKAIGAVSGNTSNDSAAIFEKILASKGLSFNHTKISANQNPILALRPIFAKSDVFIATPDRAIFNRAMAKWILNLSFQTKVPVIGFSKGYTGAGALVSLFSSPENIGQQAAEIITNFAQGSPLPDQHGIYPKYFTLETNHTIAKVLRINIAGLDSQHLSARIREAEDD